MKIPIEAKLLKFIILNHGSQESLQTNKNLTDDVSVEYFILKKLCDFLK